MDIFYSEYFTPEIMQFITNDFGKQYPYIDRIHYDFNNKKIKEEIKDFIEKRKIGENDNFLCKLIREDNIKEFIDYTKQSNISLTSSIKYSVFETNKILDHCSEKSLIEYASFFGSIQIFKYLQKNGVELTSSIWIYAIHGKNAEIIHQLEVNNIEPSDKSYIECLNRSIECHHNDLANYFINNYIHDADIIYKNCNHILENYNFYFIQDSFISESTFYLLCEYDYYLLVNLLFQEKNIDIYKEII